jgi:hypothetical protein
VQASTCLAVAGAVAIAATGVGAVAELGIAGGLAASGTVATLGSSALSAASFAQTHDPLDAVGAIPLIGKAGTAARVARTAEGGRAVRGLLGAGSDVANAGGVIRSFVTGSDQTFDRVFSANQTGRFLTAVPPRSSAFAREALALPPGNDAKLHPRSTRSGRDAPPAISCVRSLRARGGAEQFELLQRIPSENFGVGIPFG